MNHRLNCDTVTVTPRHVDWHDDSDGEYREPSPSWQSFDAEVGRHTVQLVAAGGSSVVALVWEGQTFAEDEYGTYYSAYGHLRKKERLTEEEFDEAFTIEPFMHGAEGPMMNFFYTLDMSDYRAQQFDPVDAASKITGPLCVVELDGEYGLALTGGGMDLSWEIAEAYIALGYMPPVHFELPAMAFGSTTAEHRRVINGMHQSITWLQANMGHRLERLQRLATDMGVDLTE